MKEKEFIDNFSNILRKELLNRKWPITSFSDFSGISRKTGTAFVDGTKTDMKLSTIFKICDCLEIPIKDLFNSKEKDYDGLKINLTIGGDRYVAYLNKQ